MRLESVYAEGQMLAVKLDRPDRHERERRDGHPLAELRRVEALVADFGHDGG